MCVCVCVCVCATICMGTGGSRPPFVSMKEPALHVSPTTCIGPSCPRAARAHIVLPRDCGHTHTLWDKWNAQAMCPIEGGGIASILNHLPWAKWFVQAILPTACVRTAVTRKHNLGIVVCSHHAAQCRWWSWMQLQQHLLGQIVGMILMSHMMCPNRYNATPRGGTCDSLKPFVPMKVILYLTLPIVLHWDKCFVRTT